MCSGRFCSFLFYFSFFNRDCCHLGFDATYDCQIYRVTRGNNRTVFDNRYIYQMLRGGPQEERERRGKQFLVHETK